MTDKLPGARAALVDNAGVTTPPFYRFFQAMERLQAGTASAADIAAINAQITAIQAEIAALPEASFPTLQVSAPLTSSGLLQNGFAKLGLTVANSVTVNGVALQLSGDALAPGNTYLYSTGPTGTKGWNAFSGMVTGTSGNIAKTVNADGTVTFNLAAVTDSGAGTFKLITRDTFGRLSGTKSGTTSDVPEGTNLYYTNARADARVALELSPGYIDGLQMQWVSATAVTVSSGTAYIPSLGAYLKAASPIALTGLSLTANTWYHLYLYSNAGTPAVECVTTAPVLYNGMAYQKTGDSTRRYLGSIVTDASGNINEFIHIKNSVYYAQTINRLISAGTSTTPVSVSCSSYVPVTGVSAFIKSQINTSSVSATAYFGTNASKITTNNNILTCAAVANFFSMTNGNIALDPSGNIAYFVSTSSISGVFAWITGYEFQR